MNKSVTNQGHSGLLVGETQSFLSVMEMITKVAAVDVVVFLYGETGTGKELVAKAIHGQSQRSGKTFLPIDCGAFPEQLFESELFGHMKGAFTDAKSDHKGLLAETEGGTMFLDEITSLSLRAQGKLLRLLQEKEYRPVGSCNYRNADVRIIAACNVDLKRQVQANLFREDLFHRLNVLSITLPTLRERIEDIPLLASYFLTGFRNKYGKGPVEISPDAMRKMLAYSWPGNIRELEGVIHRAVILSSSHVITVDNLSFSNELANERPSFYEAKLGVIERFECSYLRALLKVYGGNVSRAAKGGSLDRRAFQRLLRKHDIKREDFERVPRLRNPPFQTGSSVDLEDFDDDEGTLHLV